MKEEFSLRVNGKTVSVLADKDTPVLYILRNQLQLNGPKFGCGLGQCGACAILWNDQSVPSCQLTMGSIAGKEITTLEGLIGDQGKLHVVQEAFIEEQAAQCGYCTNGFIMSAIALLQRNDHPSEQDIRRRINWNICRCGVHSRVIKAITRVANQ